MYLALTTELLLDLGVGRIMACDHGKYLELGSGLGRAGLRHHEVEEALRDPETGTYPVEQIWIVILGTPLIESLRRNYGGNHVALLGVGCCLFVVEHAVQIYVKDFMF